MAKPQQPELRRSERVPALSPDASEAELSAQDLPPVDPATGNMATGPVPEEQQPGHRPADQQDKPLDKMAEALGVPAEGDEPDDAPRVDPDDTVDEIETRAEARADDRTTRGRTKVRVGILFLAPSIGYVIARAAVRAVRRRASSRS